MAFDWDSFIGGILVGVGSSVIGLVLILHFAPQLILKPLVHSGMKGVRKGIIASLKK